MHSIYDGIIKVPHSWYNFHLEKEHKSWKLEPVEWTNFNWSLIPDMSVNCAFGQKNR